MVSFVLGGGGGGLLWGKIAFWGESCGGHGAWGQQLVAATSRSTFSPSPPSKPTSASRAHPFL